MQLLITFIICIVVVITSYDGGGLLFLRLQLLIAFIISIVVDIASDDGDGLLFF